MAEEHIYTEKELKEMADQLLKEDDSQHEQADKTKARRKSGKKKENEEPVKSPEEKLHELLEKGKKAGKLTAKELECIEELNLDSEVVDKFYEALEANGVDIDIAGADLLPPIDDVLPEVEDLANIEEVTREVLGDESYAVDKALLQQQTKVVLRSTVQTRQEFEARLSKQLGKVAYGYVLYVDGEPVAATEYEGAMEELLEQLKAGYITDRTVECYFVEKTEIRQEYTTADLMMNLGYIAEKLNATKAGAVTYTVQAGDTFYDIAMEHDMGVNTLLNLNPGYQADMIHVGDTLTISNAVPYLTVVDVERQSYLQDVAYSVEYQDDSSIYEGDYRVLKAGTYGKEDVTANVTYINGTEVSRDVVAAVTLSQPIAELQARGTKERPSWAATGSLRWPCSGIITSYFGYRDIGVSGASSNHGALDIAAGWGTPIYAADGGTVISSGWDGGYGYRIRIDHGNGMVTLYAHCSSLEVGVGEHVYKGQLIASMGSTGISTGSHCHFGVYINGTAVDPLNYL